MWICVGVKPAEMSHRRPSGENWLTWLLMGKCDIWMLLPVKNSASYLCSFCANWSGFVLGRYRTSFWLYFPVWKRLSKPLITKCKHFFYPWVFWNLLIDMTELTPESMSLSETDRLCDPMFTTSQSWHFFCVCAQTVFSGFSREKLTSWRKVYLFSKHAAKLLTPVKSQDHSG